MEKDSAFAACGVQVRASKKRVVMRAFFSERARGVGRVGVPRRMSGAFARFVTENRLTHPAQAYHKKVDDDKDLEDGLPPGAAAAQQPRLQRRRWAAAFGLLGFACVHMCVHTVLHAPLGAAMHTVQADRPDRHAEAAAQPASLEPSHVPQSHLVEAEAELEALQRDPAAQRSVVCVMMRSHAVAPHLADILQRDIEADWCAEPEPVGQPTLDHGRRSGPEPKPKLAPGQVRQHRAGVPQGLRGAAVARVRRSRCDPATT